MHIQANQSSQATLSDLSSLQVSANNLSPLQQFPTVISDTSNRSQPAITSISNDPFDMDAQPIMYMTDNRTPAITDMSLIITCIIFLTCILLVLMLLPSIRRNKWRNFLCLMLIITLGASIPLAIMRNTWMTGELELDSVPYDSFYRNQFSGLLRVEVGLNSMNVSLIGQVITTTSVTEGEQQQSQVKHVHYNERFRFDKPEEMQLEHIDALQRGLPYPILSVSEYFSQDSEGFNWTRQLRQTGFYTNFLLYITLACWLVSLFIMCILPAYLMTMLRTTCLLSTASYLNYLIRTTLFMPLNNVIYIQSARLEIEPNISILVCVIGSIAAYYCAHLIGASSLDDDEDPLTIMDSEGYLKDKKALKAIRDKAQHQQVRSNSVIIPIADIEQTFGPAKGN